MSYIQGIDPRDGSSTGRVAETSAAELDAMLAEAERAGREYTDAGFEARIALLDGLAAALDAASADLVEIADRETGLGPARLEGEVARTSGQLRLFADVVREGSFLDVTIDHAQPAAVPPRPDLRRVLEPIGPVLVFAASNFPFAFSVLGGDTASALAAGCAVVVKAHDGHPNLSAAVGRLARGAAAGAGLAEELITVVFGVDAGLRALADRRIRACGFTGSTAGGRALFDLASARPDPIPFYGELGSINPVVVTPDALAARGEEIADGFVGSFTMGAGQFCTKPGLLFLPKDHELAAALQERVERLSPVPMLNLRIRDAFDGLAAQVESSPGVDVVGAAEGSSAADGAWGTPRLYATTAAELIRDPDLLTAECFGPASLLVAYEDVTELIAALACVEGSLSAGLHAEPDDSLPLAELVGALRRFAGRVIWNGWPTGVAVAWAMQHGGPWPSTTSPTHTSVGAAAIGRWLRPVTYQGVPDAFLPAALREGNPCKLRRRIDGELELTASVGSHLADR